jgi:predicted O-methyltransferase YrrM
MNILRKLSRLNQAVNDNLNLVRNTEDIYCLGLLDKLLQSGGPLPFTFMSLRPFAVAFVVNELLINKRNSIMEFGSGISTVIIARAMKVHGMNAKLVSVESDKEWSDLTGELLEKEGLTSYVELIHAPLTHRDWKGRSLLWYDELTLRERLRSFTPVDMVLIDGPAAYNQHYGLNRYFAMPFLKDRLAENHCIFLDDANRDGEKQVLDYWKNEYGMESKVFADTLAVYYEGSHHDCCPMKFVSKS